MDERPDNLEPLLDCLESWENPEFRQRAAEGVADRRDLARALADQRAIDLALRAREKTNAFHLSLRQKILQSVQEEAAPAAVRASIVSAVEAEARRGTPRDSASQSPFQGWQSAFRGWRMAGFAGAAAMLLASGLWLFRQPREIPRVPISVAHIETAAGSVERISRSSAASLKAADQIRSGDWLRTGTNSAATVSLTNGTRLQAGPETEIYAHVEPAASNRWKLIRGLLSASTAAPLRLETMDLLVTATNASLNVERSAGGTRVHVTAGAAVVARSASRQTAVKAGEIVHVDSGEAGDAALKTRPFERDILAWPFSSSSPWNTSIGSAALPDRIRAPGWPPRNITNTVLVRPIVMAGAGHPRVNLLSPGEEPRPLRYPADWKPVLTRGEFVCALFPEDRLCCEMTEPERLASGDIRVRERHSTDLAGNGAGWSWPYPRSIGGPAIAGLIRHGELTFGIQHALALAVNARFLNADAGIEGHRWPGVPIAPELRSTFGREGNLVIGSLLVIPPRVDLASLLAATSGPGFEIARALQDYGAYVIQTTDGEFKLIAAADAGLPPDIDEIMNFLVPRLVLVSNQSLRNVGGGGERRRPPAPPLAQ